MQLRTFWGLFFFLLVGCSKVEPIPIATNTLTRTQVPSATSTFTATPLLPTPTLLPTTPTSSPTPELAICSLVDDISVQNLADRIVNPFAPPRLGSDDPHQGVDFADIDPNFGIALEGRIVNAVIKGTVAGVITDRFPYGNALLVETPLEHLPSEWLGNLQIPTPAPPRDGHPSLTCPDIAQIPDPAIGPRSLYLIYAHLQESVSLNLGDSVTCGMPVGAIGNSGNSLNPHIHLEIRVGPADMRFESMAHYTGSASLEEMSNYCLWRVSEVFQILDPMLLLSQGTNASR